MGAAGELTEHRGAAGCRWGSSVAAQHRRRGRRGQAAPKSPRRSDQPRKLAPLSGKLVPVQLGNSRSREAPAQAVFPPRPASPSASWRHLGTCAGGLDKSWNPGPGLPSPGICCGRSTAPEDALKREQGTPRPQPGTMGAVSLQLLLLLGALCLAPLAAGEPQPHWPPPGLAGGAARLPGGW